MRTRKELEQARAHKKKRPSIAVVGSLHKDLILKTARIPQKGETVTGKDFKTAPGGKGANQAVAAAKLGADVTMIGTVGADSYGEELIDSARRQGIDTSYIRKDIESYTGLAFIVVDDDGNNIIAVAPGADLACNEKDIEKALPVIEACDMLVTQLETPLSVVAYAIEKAFQHGVRVVLNPAPGRPLPRKLLAETYVLAPNESEAEMICGSKITDLNSAMKAAEEIMRKGARNVVLTIGEKGAIMATPTDTVHVEAPVVEAVDTTGAGDAFCGALAVALSLGKELEEAIVYANCAGALATTRIGAQEALPTAEELERFMRKRALT